MYAAVTSFNAADLLMTVIIATIVRVGWRGRVMSEFVKLFGILCTIFITLHYYVRFANFLRVQFFGRDTSTEFFAFTLLAVFFSVVFIFLGRGWALLWKMKAHPRTDRYGGLIVSLARSYFTCGLIFFALVLSGHGFVMPTARGSLTSMLFRHVAEDFYRTSHSVLIEDFFPGETINEAALTLTARKAHEK